MKVVHAIPDVPETDNKEIIIRRCLKELYDLLDPEKYSPEIPEEIINRQDKNGKQYRCQKNWFNAFVWILNDITLDLNPSEKLKHRIKYFKNNIFPIVAQKRLTEASDIDITAEFMEEVVDELEEELYEDQDDTAIRKVITATEQKLQSKIS